MKEEGFMKEELLNLKKFLDEGFYRIERRLEEIEKKLDNERLVTNLN